MRRVFRFLKALWRYILHGNRVPFNLYCERLTRCSGCHGFREDNWTCGICGCYLDKKAKMSTERCPDGKW